MPSIAQAPPSPQLNGRKRSRDDFCNDAGAMMDLHIEMKLAASPLRFHHQTTTLSQADMLASERKHILPRPRRDREIHNKKQRTTEAWEALTTLPDMERDVEFSPKEEVMLPTIYPTKIDLSPCHICHRKPSERRELDGYANCEGCGRRTCYVCIRQCEGLERDRYFGSRDVFGGMDGQFDLNSSWHADEMCIERSVKPSAWDDAIDGKTFSREPWGKEDMMRHRGKVCSRCCVERRTEGEVCCLGCLRAEESLMRDETGYAAGQEFKFERRNAIDEGRVVGDGIREGDWSDCF